MQSIKSRLTGRGRGGDERGQTLPLFAAGLIGLIGLVALSIDVGRLVWARTQMQAAVDFRRDILNGVIKSIVFGVAVSLVAVFEGYDSDATAEGVSRATTRTVVTSSLAILGLDFILTPFMFRG